MSDRTIVLVGAWERRVFASWLRVPSSEVRGGSVNLESDLDNFILFAGWSMLARLSEHVRDPAVVKDDGKMARLSRWPYLESTSCGGWPQIDSYTVARRCFWQRCEHPKTSSAVRCMPKERDLKCFKHFDRSTVELSLSLMGDPEKLLKSRNDRVCSLWEKEWQLAQGSASTERRTTVPTLASWRQSGIVHRVP